MLPLGIRFVDKSLEVIQFPLLPPLCPVFVVLLWAVTPLLLPLLLELWTLRWLSGRGHSCGRDSGEGVDAVTRVHTVTNNISDKCWYKFFIEWAQVVNTAPPVATSSSTTVFTVQILSLTTTDSFNSKLPSHHNLHIILCIDQLQVRVHLLPLLLNLGY